jgi:hypothetical protein
MTPASSLSHDPFATVEEFFHDCGYNPPAKGQGHGGELFLTDTSS